MSLPKILFNTGRFVGGLALSFGANNTPAVPVTEATPLPVTSAADVIEVVLTLDTSGGYADGDVLADFQEVTNFVRALGGRALIQSITVVDKDDVGLAFDILTSRSAISLGTENAAPSISDANAVGVQRIVRIETTDYIDLGGCRVATRAPVGVVIEAASDTRSMWVGAIVRGAGTYSAAGLVLRFGVVWF